MTVVQAAGVAAGAPPTPGRRRRSSDPSGYLFAAPAMVLASIFSLLPLALAFLVGTIGGVALKLAEAPALLTAGFAAAVLVAYALFSYAATRLRLDTETIGDNCYYLGFLLTLSSLSATLYQLTQSDQQAELMRSIIAGFGVALISMVLIWKIDTTPIVTPASRSDHAAV